MKYNQDIKIRELEKKAFNINPIETENLNNYYYGDFNKRTGDMNIFFYETELKIIINKEETWQNED